MTEKLKPPSKGGRPPYRPSLEDRQTVQEMKFCGESDNMIARALGIDVDTMRKHLQSELEDGHAHRRKEVIGLLFKSARDGNVSAQKKLEEMGRIAGAIDVVNARGKKPEPKEEKLGKKEQRQAVADSVGGKFAVPSAPKLVVHNK